MASRAWTLLAQFDHTCVWCGRRVFLPYDRPDGTGATIDHLTPKCRLPAPVRDAVKVLACRRCNEAKADMTGDEFLYFLAEGRFAPSYIAYLERRVDARMGRTRNVAKPQALGLWPTQEVAMPDFKQANAQDNPQPGPADYPRLVASVVLAEAIEKAGRLSGAFYLNGVHFPQFEAIQVGNVLSQFNLASGTTFVMALLDDEGHLVLKSLSAAEIYLEDDSRGARDRQRERIRQRNVSQGMPDRNPDRDLDEHHNVLRQMGLLDAKREGAWPQAPEKAEPVARGDDPAAQPQAGIPDTDPPVPSVPSVGVSGSVGGEPQSGDATNVGNTDRAGTDAAADTQRAPEPQAQPAPTPPAAPVAS